MDVVPPARRVCGPVRTRDVDCRPGAGTSRPRSIVSTAYGTPPDTRRTSPSGATPGVSLRSSNARTLASSRLRRTTTMSLAKRPARIGDLDEQRPRRIGRHGGRGAGHDSERRLLASREASHEREGAGRVACSGDYSVAAAKDPTCERQKFSQGPRHTDRAVRVRTDAPRRSGPRRGAGRSGRRRASGGASAGGPGRPGSASGWPLTGSRARAASTARRRPRRRCRRSRRLGPGLRAPRSARAPQCRGTRKPYTGSEGGRLHCSRRRRAPEGFKDH